MPSNKKILVNLLAIALVLGVQTSQAREIKEEKQTVAAQVPITIEANQLSFSDETGDILAYGNVVITNQGQRIEAEQINGNAKLSEIWINDQAHFSEPDTNLSGSHTVYNYKLRTGSMEDVKGKVGRKYVSGRTISMVPDQFTIDHGTATNCPAKIPDYHISADKIEIWPGDKLIAYNAKFWIGKTVIFTLPKYRQSIKPGEDGGAFP
ncbi:MAG: LPS-assembly protein LptD, partial [Sporomusa sp.]